MTSQNQPQNQNQNQSQNQRTRKAGNQPQPQNQPESAEVLASMAGAPASESLADKLARLKAAEAVYSVQRRKAVRREAAQVAKPINWPAAVREAAESLTPAFILPTVRPAKGLSHEGICAERRVFAVGPADDAMLNQPVPTNEDAKRRDAMLDLIRSIIHNELYGEPIYTGPSLADGGKVDLAEILVCLHFGAKYKGTKWAHTLWNYKSAQTALLYKFAELSGRYAILDCDTFKVELVRDFHL